MGRVLEANDGSFEALVLKAEETVLVDFGAPWCGPCKRLEPIVHELAADYDGRLRVVKVNVDEAPGTAAKYAVLSVPTVLLFRGGEKKDEILGLVSKKALIERIEKVV